MWLLRNRFGARRNPSELSKVLADGVTEAGVKERYGHESSSENDECSESFRCGESPDVDENDFGDADEEERKAGEAEAAFTDDEGEEKGDEAEEAPGYRDMAGAEFNGECDDHQSERGKEQPLLGMLDGTGEGFGDRE